MASNGFDFARELALVINQSRGRGVAFATLTADLGAISTALGSDTATHDRTIQAPPAALNQAAVDSVRHIRETNRLINVAKANGKTAAAIKSDVDAAVAALGGETVLKDVTLAEPAAAVLKTGNKHP